MIDQMVSDYTNWMFKSFGDLKQCCMEIWLHSSPEEEFDLKNFMEETGYAEAQVNFCLPLYK